MFFFFGIMPGEKDLGVHAGWKVRVIYSTVLLFFIPVFRFGRRYLAERSGRTVELSAEVGRAIERGEEPDLNIGSADRIDYGRGAYGSSAFSYSDAAEYGDSAGAGSRAAAGRTASETEEMTEENGQMNDTAPVRLKERRLVHTGSILEIYDDTVEVDGREAHWDYIHHKGAAAVVPVTGDGKIIMVRQYRNAIGQYTLEIPAGKLDGQGEPVARCARRELEEETGYTSDSLRHLLSLHPTVAYCDELIEIFVARDLVKTAQHLDEDERIDVETYTVDELKQMIYEGKITDAKTIAGILAYECGIAEKY